MCSFDKTGWHDSSSVTFLEQSKRLPFRKRQPYKQFLANVKIIHTLLVYELDAENIIFTPFIPSDFVTLGEITHSTGQFHFSCKLF